VATTEGTGIDETGGKSWFQIFMMNGYWIAVAVALLIMIADIYYAYTGDIDYDWSFWGVLIFMAVIITVIMLKMNQFYNDLKHGNSR
jgi:hypothetical protein